MLTVAFVTLVTVLVAAVPAHGTPADPDVGDLDRQITDAANRLEVLIEQRNALRADLSATQARLAETTARLDRDNAQLQELREHAGAIAASAYRTLPASRVAAVLAAGSPGVLVDQLTALEGLGLRTRGHLSGLAVLLESLQRERAAATALAQAQEEQEATFAELTAKVERDLSSLRQERSRTAAALHITAAPPRPVVEGAAAAAVAFAYAQLGRPYLYGAAGPNAYDCSGLTMAAWAAAGVSLPHNAARQYQSVAHLARASLAHGDLVFYYRDIHHVAIYIGNGQVIHAPRTGDVVRVANIDMAPIYGYGRP